MKRLIILICILFSLSTVLPGQKFETITVRAGMKVADFFPASERYRYPEFVGGRIVLKTGVYSDTKLNYNLLTTEIQYIRGKDTLSIANKKDIRYVLAARDTFYCFRGLYFEQISAGSMKLVLKQYFKLKETQKQDSYGTTSAGSATESYNSFSSPGNFYKLTANTDMVFQRTLEYYISDGSGGFEPCNRKNIMQLYPAKKDEIKNYLKTNKTDFENKDDLIKLIEYLSGMI